MGWSLSFGEQSKSQSYGGAQGTDSSLCKPNLRLRLAGTFETENFYEIDSNEETKIFSPQG
jgi:hypothetical protein